MQKKAFLASVLACAVGAVLGNILADILRRKYIIIPVTDDD